jgi:hypothetical protein
MIIGRGGNVNRTPPYIFGIRAGFIYITAGVNAGGGGKHLLVARTKEDYQDQEKKQQFTAAVSKLWAIAENEYQQYEE